MAGSEWTWDPASRRYRSTATGRWLSHSGVAALRSAFALEQRSWADTAAAALGRRDWTVRRWELEIRARLKTVYLAEYLLGRGGQPSMTPTDYGRVGGLLAEQYAFLRQFALDIQGGTLSEGQIAARTQLYHASAIQAFERGKAAAYSPTLILPAYPADGSAECRANDSCRWRITETKTAWRATWTLGHAEHCETCLVRSRTWNPLRIAKTPE